MGADSEKFDIGAKPDKPGMPSVKQMKVMLQKLLAERFSFASQKDTKARSWNAAFRRRCSSPEAQSATSNPDATGPVQRDDQQLGLRMQKLKGPVEVMIIDKVEKPSPN